MDLTTRPRRTGVVALLSVLLVAAGCGGAASTPSPAPTPPHTVAPAPTAVASPAPATSAAPSVLPLASVAANASPAIASTQVCADLATLQASLDALTGVDLSTAGVLSTLDAVRLVLTNGQAFVQSATTAFDPEARALGDALGGLRTAVGGITGSGTLGDKAATIEKAIDGVAAEFDALKAKVNPRCPAASPAASPSAS